MPAYIVAEVEVSDPVAHAEYRKLAGPAVEAYGGRYLARGGAMEVMEGDWSPARLVVIEFDTPEQAKRFYNSPEYQAARAKRKNAGRMDMVLVEGIRK